MTPSTPAQERALSGLLDAQRTHLDAIAALADADHHVARAIKACLQDTSDQRAERITWEDIATALGVPQAKSAHRRYGAAVEELRRVPKVGREEALAAAVEAGKAVRAATASRDAADDALLPHVAACRQEDVTWQAIADVLGRAQPNVVTEYGPHLEVTRTVTPRN